MATALAEGLSFTITDEQRALRELAHDFAEKEIRPQAAEYDVHMTHPADVIAKAHEVGLMNLHVPAEYGGPELALLEGCLVAEELNWGCSGIGTSLGVQRPRRRPADRRRHRRAEARVAPAAHRGADPLLLRAHRARRRLRRRADQDDRRPQRRRVRPQRLEDVHHERRLRGLDGRLREDRSVRRPQRDVGLHRPDGHAGRDDRAAPRQDGPALDRHLRVLDVRRRRPGRQPPRRGGRRLQDRDA